MSVIGNIITEVVNLSFQPFEQCAALHSGTSSENLGLQQMGDIRVISLAAVRGFGRQPNQSETEFRQSMVKNNVIGKQLGQ